MLRDESISIKEDFYILARGAQPEEAPHVLKHGDTLAILDPYGDIRQVGVGKQGLYYGNTRFLSRYLCLIQGIGRPLFLSSTVQQNNVLLSANLTNPDFSKDGVVIIPRGVLHIFRAAFLWHGVFYERLIVRNFGRNGVEATLRFEFGADFADIFEIRGQKRERRGALLPPRHTRGSAVLGYRCLNGRLQQTRLTCFPAPQVASPDAWHVQLTIPKQGETEVWLSATCEQPPANHPRPPYLAAHRRAEAASREAVEQYVRVESSNTRFTAWWDRSIADLAMMTTATPHGPYPYAGVPWFNTAFGRDGLITAMACLWVNPRLARGVLSFLADLQATRTIPDQDAEPGKILHEMRQGEMADLKEVPFGRYYGSVDSTPLFVMLAAAYYRRTADLDFIRRLWPHVEQALRWIDKYGDRDRDGFVEYYRATPAGLANQGWKDSHDAVFHADGRLAEGAVSLCEVQAYVFAAKRGAAELAAALGRRRRAAALQREARQLQARFEAAFWIEELGTYALALDGKKRPCKVRTSNPGHALCTGILPPARASRVARTLLEASSFSGWGIRTVATTEARYNPMSYHNGTVWPHDNAMIAWGMACSGMTDAARRIFEGLYEASRELPLYRLPELFCGFERRSGEAPTLYPVACSPQAWAASAACQLLQSCLGLSIDAPARRIRIRYPALPEALKELHLYNLQVEEASLDLSIQRHGGDVGITVMRKEGAVDLEVIK